MGALRAFLRSANCQPQFIAPELRLILMRKNEKFKRLNFNYHQARALFIPSHPFTFNGPPLNNLKLPFRGA